MNKTKLAVLLFLATILTFAVVLSLMFRRTANRSEARKQEINLIVYAPKSFIDSFGPGDAIKKQFEEKCQCTVEYIDVGGSATTIEKIKLDEKRRVDVVVGMDLLLLDRVFHSIRVQDLEKPQVELRDELKDMVFPRFVPYDWAPMGFIYRKGELKESQSLQAFLAEAPEKSVALEDPEVSSTGLEWLYWLYKTATLNQSLNQSKFEGALQSLRRVTAMVAPTWSSAYGLFKKNQAKAVFSYQTSLVYHRAVEKDYRYEFMQFSEGHPAQIEYAFVPDACWNCTVAKKFVENLLTPEVQKILAEKNFMLPVIKNVELSEEFQKLPKVKILPREGLDQFARRQSEIIEEWKKQNP